MSTGEDGTKQRILEAAGAIFAEQGFEGATIREICTAAKVNLAAVNYHFGDKDRLYKAVVRHAHELAISQVPLPEWNAATAPEQKLRDFVSIMLQRMLVMQRLPWQSRLMMREFVQPTGACLDLVEDYIRPHFQMLLEILDAMLPAETPRHRRYQMAFSVVGQCLFYKMNAPVTDLLLPREDQDRYFSTEMLADHISAVTLAALGRRSMTWSGQESPLHPLAAEAPGAGALSAGAPDAEALSAEASRFETPSPTLGSQSRVNA